MKFIPILFSTPMVQAILENRKTQTRRVIKNISIEENKHGSFNYKAKGFGGTNIPKEDLSCDFLGISSLCKYNIGDILWVRESFHYVLDSETLDFLNYDYKADREYYNKTGKWKPSIHMPKDACRLFLQIKDRRVERLLDISEKDAKAEGIRFYYDEVLQSNRYKHYVYDSSGYGNPEVDYPCASQANHSFFSLWVKINGQQSFESNPWVWVIEFERIDKPDNFC